MKWTETSYLVQQQKPALETYVLVFFKTDLMKTIIDEGIKMRADQVS